MNIYKRSYVIFVVLLAVAMALAGSQSALAQSPVTLTGVFTAVYGDGPAGTAAPDPFYSLVDSSGLETRLLIDETTILPEGGLIALERRTVTVRGFYVQSGENSVLQVSSITLAIQAGVNVSGAVSASVYGSKPFISIMCKFADTSAVEPYPLSFFQGMYSSAFPGLDHYWRELSYDNMNILGSTALGWYTLPRIRSAYILGDGSFDLTLVAQDCTALADPYVNFNSFHGINLMFNGDLDGYAWGGSAYITLDGVTKSWPMTWEPPWGYENVAVIAHEMGHSFSLHHSSNYETLTGYPYNNRWDVMSDTWGNCIYGVNDDATYGCLGQHTISYHKDKLGWIPAGQKFTPTLGSNAFFILERLALPTNGNYKMVQIPINGSSTNFYTVEVRKKVGYDSILPYDSVIIHEVNTSRSEEALVQGSNGGVGAVRTPGNVFRVTSNDSNAANEISVSVVYATSTGYAIHVAYGQEVYYISGRLTLSGVGLAGETVNYTGGSTVTDSEGYYSIAVPKNWSGTVTPVKAGYTFSPLSRTYNLVANNFFTQNYAATANPVISGNVGVSGVTLSYTDGTAKTVTSAVDGSYSFSVPAGWTGTLTPTHTCYTFSPVNRVFSVAVATNQTQNFTPTPNPSCAAVDVRIANQYKGTYYLASGQSVTPGYDGLMGGPVQVTSTNGMLIFASERSVFAGTSFNETMGYPTNRLTTEYWFPWYDKSTMMTRVLIGNPNAIETARVELYIGGVYKETFNILPYGSVTPGYDGLVGGPVRVLSIPNGNGVTVPIFASERAVYAGVSFDEMMGYPANRLTTEYWFPWYDKKSMVTDLVIGNTDGVETAKVEVYIAGEYKETLDILPYESATAWYDGVMGGPVRVLSIPNVNGVTVPVVASERSVYKGTSFNETMGFPTNQLTTEYWFPWYDKKSMMTRVLIGNPDEVEPARVELYIGGVYKETFNIVPYGSVTPGYDGVMGGPVRVLSIPNVNGVTVPIFTSERSVFAGVSFNETMGYPANQLTTEYWFPWYDKKSMITRVLIGRP